MYITNTALVRATNKTSRFSRSVWLTLSFIGKFLNNCCCLPQSGEFHHFVTDNQVPGIPAFDPLLPLLSEAAEMQPPNILVHASARQGQNPTTGLCAAGDWWKRVGEPPPQPFRGAFSLMIHQPAGAEANGIAVTSSYMANCPSSHGHLLRTRVLDPFLCGTLNPLHIHIIYQRCVDLFPNLFVQPWGES